MFRMILIQWMLVIEKNGRLTYQGNADTASRHTIEIRLGFIDSLIVSAHARRGNASPKATPTKSANQQYALKFFLE